MLRWAMVAPLSGRIGSEICWLMLCFGVLRVREAQRYPGQAFGRQTGTLHVLEQREEGVKR